MLAKFHAFVKMAVSFLGFGHGHHAYLAYAYYAK